jgi:hypothetical protein
VKQTFLAGAGTDCLHRILVEDFAKVHVKAFWSMRPTGSAR